MGRLFDNYETSKDLETKGVWLRDDDSKILCARSGNGNDDWWKIIFEETKEYGKGEFVHLDPPDQLHVFRMVYSKAIIKDHLIRDENGEWISAVEIRDDDGEVKTVPFTPENMCRCLKQLPDYFKKIQTWAEDYKTFRAIQLKGQEKN